MKVVNLRRTGVVLASLVLCSTVEGADNAAFYVAARKVQPLPEAERKAREPELDQKRKQADDERKALEKRLNKEHGRDFDKWPDAPRRELGIADGALAMATLDRLLLNDDAEGIGDSVADLKTAFAKQVKGDEVTVADSPESATVLVEVLARRSKMGPVWYVYLKVTPRDWLDPARLEQASFSHGAVQYNYAGIVTTAHRYEPSAPYWILEVAKIGAAAGTWKETANYAAQALIAQARAARRPTP
jgi:hypothetical protein